MTIIEALVQLRNDLKLWVTNNLRAHFGDTVLHVSEEDRTAWNAAKTHIGDDVAHVTGDERAAWNSTNTHVSDSVVHLTSDERTAWNAAKTHADSEHGPKRITTGDGLGTSSSSNKPGELMIWMVPKTSMEIAEVTLTVDGWSDFKQTVSVGAVTATNVIIPASAPSNRAEYAESGVCCIEQSEGALTFECDNIPALDLVVNVVILDQLGVTS